jgi:hypothetical protein
LLTPARLKSYGFVRVEPVRRAWQEHIEGTRNWQYPLWTVLMLQAWLAAEGLVGEAIEHALAGGDAERAATLLGAAIAVRGAPDRSRPEMVALAERVRERLGPDAYRRASERGAAMTRDATLAYAAERPAAQARRR